MPPKKKKKAQSKSGKSGTPAFPRVLIVVLVVLLIAGIALVKYFQTPGGRGRLLDGGLHDYYAEVQTEIGVALRQVMVDHEIDERAVAEYAGGNKVRCLEWRIACDASCNYIMINVALTKAVRRSGGRVRHSEETDGGDTFRFTVGTHRYDTHRLIFTRDDDRTAARPPKRPPRVALVIDDLGYSRGDVVKDILALDLPLTIAILPSLPYSTFALERAQKQGKCTILHLPMEPDGDEGSDLAKVTTDMDRAEIERLVVRYIQSLPGIEGVNNHQGSRATADPRVMAVVLAVIDDFDLFFLDSLTSPKSVAYNTAREMGVAAARNGLFLDADTEDAEVVERRIRELVSAARRNGSAVGIGHPRRWTLDALENSKAFLESADIELVYLTDIVD